MKKSLFFGRIKKKQYLCMIFINKNTHFLLVKTLI